MARNPKAAEYERTSRLRKVYDVQANMLGWSKVDTLAAYLTDEDELIVFDRQERRLTGTAEQLPAETLAQVIVEPLSVPVDEWVSRWQQGHEKVSKAVAGLDLSKLKREDALKLFTELAAISLRGVEILRRYDGPDWREQLGLDKVP